ncbi:hypothetical protein D3C72_1221280 [compost metagenome]
MTATMLSEKTVTFCSDWRGPGAKTTGDGPFGATGVMPTVGSSAANGRDTSEPAL